MSHEPKNSRHRAGETLRSRPRSRGFTLTELMVAILLGLFLMGGVLTLIQSMKRATGLQSNLSQMQDSERFATDLIADVVQAAGNFPTAANGGIATTFFPKVTVAVTGIPAGGVNLTFDKGQVLAGVDTGAAQGAVFAVRYSTSGTDNLTGCDGNPSTGASVTWINIFSIDANNNLQCQLYTMDNLGNTQKTSTTTLVSGVTTMVVNYGLLTNNPNGSGYTAPDAYLTATQVLALPSADLPVVCCGAVDNWADTKSVKLQLTFTNPLFGQPSQPPTLSVTRVFQVMTQGA